MGAQLYGRISDSTPRVHCSDLEYFDAYYIEMPMPHLTEGLNSINFYQNNLKIVNFVYTVSQY